MLLCVVIPNERPHSVKSLVARGRQRDDEGPKLVMKLHSQRGNRIGAEFFESVVQAREHRAEPPRFEKLIDQWGGLSQSLLRESKIVPVREVYELLQLHRVDRMVLRDRLPKKQIGN